MGEKLVVGPLNRGLRTDRLPFVIDNDNFPVIINAYQWRGRVKRKRGTSLLGRLQLNIGTTNGSGNATITINPHPIESGVSSFVIGTDVFVDPGGSSPVTLLTNSTGSGTLNRTTGVLTITGSQLSTAIIYFPSLPVMGLRELAILAANYPGTLAFDTTYSYNIPTTAPYTPYNVSFYKNPATSSSLPGYIPKPKTPTPAQTPLNWNGEDYQQFWSTNYSGAFWVTNGIDTNPVTLANVGMQFKPIVAVTVTSGGPPAIVNLQITGHGLVVGDFLFINEVVTTTGINFQTGYVIAVVDANNVTVEFPNATIATNGTGGIAQYLTNTALPTKDCIRWYDGDPTNGTGISSASPFGWVNFMPPLFPGFLSNVTIANLPPAQYYLVGARLILPFKDRLLFFGPVVQSSTTGPFYLQDTIIYSQNGTPFYTASFTGSPTLPTTTFNPILVPVNQTATANSYFVTPTGFGGAVTAGVAQPIITVGANQDALVVGFGNSLQTKIIYTGDDILPFLFYTTNSELGSSSTFSSIVMDEGVITRGSRGYIITDQTSSQRIDLDNLDQAFQIALTNNGAERFTAQRDYINEWIYFTYPSISNSNIYPTQTFLYNYRDNSWAIFNESYTTYGQFRPTSGYTWLTIPWTWETWNTPWDSGSTTLYDPFVIAGNQQGFVLKREGSSTYEDNSLAIQNISGQTITSPNHCLNLGDYIIINGCLGTVASIVNNQIFQVDSVSTNTFVVSSPPVITGTYLGGGLIKRLYVPFIQTKQFPVSWGFARKTRIGSQQYLLTKTPNGQITVQIYLSQDGNDPYNAGSIVPTTNPEPQNNALIYSQTVFTSPEYYSQAITRGALGTIGNGSLTSFTFNYPAIFGYVNYGIIPGSISILIGAVATFTDNGTGDFIVTGTGTSSGSTIDYANGIITIAFTSAPTTQIATTAFQYNVTNIQSPIAASQQQIWHRMNTSLLGDTIQLGFTLSDAQMRQTSINGNPTSSIEEFELHGFVLDVSPSQALV